MWDVSDRWDSALRSSHRVVCRVEIWRSGVQVLSAGQPTGMTVVGGSVRVDGTSKVRRALSLESADVLRMPTEVGGILSPVDTDLKVFTGVEFTEGDEELVPVGVFRVASVTRSSLNGGLTVAGQDYAGVCADARFPRPWNVPRNSYVTAQIGALVTDVLPWVEVVDVTGDRTRHPGGVFERDRWDAVQSLAASVGADVAFDPAGRLLIRPLPTLDDTPHWVIDYGTPQSVLVDASVSMSTEGLYNAVTATSSDSGTSPVSATVYQATGPLRWRDGFQRTRFYASPVLKTRQQCVAAARTVLARSAVLSQQVAPTSAPNPALDVGDTVLVPLPGQDPTSRLVSGFTLPLGPGAMPVTVRAPGDGAEMDGTS